MHALYKMKYLQNEARKQTSVKEVTNTANFRVTCESSACVRQSCKRTIGMACANTRAQPSYLLKVLQEVDIKFNSLNSKGCSIQAEIGDQWLIQPNNLKLKSFQHFHKKGISFDESNQQCLKLFILHLLVHKFNTKLITPHFEKSQTTTKFGLSLTEMKSFTTKGENLLSFFNLKTNFKRIPVI